MGKITLEVRLVRRGQNYEVEFDERDRTEEIEETLEKLGLFNKGDSLLLPCGVITHSLGRMIKDGKLRGQGPLLVGTITNGGKFNLL